MMKGMNLMIVPAPLQQGDKIALLAPCSPVDPEQLRPAAEFIEALGYVPEIYPSCTSRMGFLAGSDEERAADINRAFSDPAIRAMIAIRGGYGGARLANFLDYDIIKSNPKIFCGLSDVTVLHLLLRQRCGLATFHAPMPGVAAMREDAFTRRTLADVLRGHWAWNLRSPDLPITCLCEGMAEGILTGGNLTVIVSTIGTPYEIDTEGNILFLEDVGEMAYALDRLLVQLRDSGKLAACRGVILGTWQDCPFLPDFPQEKMFREFFEPLHVPVIAGLPCGHSVPSLSLPLGFHVQMQAHEDDCRIMIKP